VFFSSWNVSLIIVGLSTSHLTQGTDKHHSVSISVSFQNSNISGFIIIIVLKFSSSRSFSMLTTTSFIQAHICGAAKPTQPLSGFLIYLIISLPNLTAF
jgi:hypothetical protein